MMWRCEVENFMLGSHNMSRQIWINIESKLYESGCGFGIKMKIVAFILTRDKLQVTVKSNEKTSKMFLEKTKKRKMF